MTDFNNNVVPLSNAKTDGTGYKRPPVHSRFKPGQSGNPSGRAKGSKNLKTLLHQILNEQIALQDGSRSKVTKAEAVMRRLVIGALKGDSRSLMTLMRIAEQAGEFEDRADRGPVIFRWQTTYEAAQTGSEQP